VDMRFEMMMVIVLGWAVVLFSRLEVVIGVVRESVIESGEADLYNECGWC